MSHPRTCAVLKDLEVLFFAQDKAEELACSFLLLDLGGLNVVIELSGLRSGSAELMLVVNLRVSSDEVFDDLRLQKVNNNTEPLDDIGCCSYVPNDNRRARICEMKSVHVL
jgi:hypothetical protein